MAEVKWIKITTEMFEDDKIDYIQTLPESDAILVIWVRLLTLAGKCNAGGYIYLTENIPYDANMLSDKFRKPITVVNMALTVFSRLGMIDDTENGIFIANWEKHQNIDALEKIREQGRKRVADHRSRKKEELPEGITESCNVTVTQEVTPCNGIEEDIDIDIDKDNKNKELKDSSIENLHNKSVPYENIINLYNDICGSKLPSVKYLSQDRKKAIKISWIRIEGYRDEKLETFRNLFTIANSSDFLTGNNDRSWRADFNWLIKEKNMVKVLERAYCSRAGSSRKEDVYGGAKQDTENGSSSEYDFSKYTG